MTSPTPVEAQPTAPVVEPAAPAQVAAPQALTATELSKLMPGNQFPQPDPWAEEAAARAAATATPTAPAAPAQVAQTADELPDGWRKHIEDLRKENAKLRTESKADAQAAAAAAKADILGMFRKVVDPDGETADLTPEELLAQAQAKAAQDAADSAAKIAAAEQLAAENAAKARATDVALTVHRRAGDDVNTDMLLDSGAFGAELAKLDPTAADFSQQVDTTIAAFVERNPGYRKPVGLVASVPRSGGSFEAGNAHQPAGEPSVDALLKQMHEGRNPSGRGARAFYNRK